MDSSSLSIPLINSTPPALDLTTEDVVVLADELIAYHSEFAPLFYRKEQAHWSLKYLQGLMLPIERKSIQPMALALEGGNIQALQQFISDGRWKDEVVLSHHWTLVGQSLGQDDGVVIFDGSGFPKKGTHSAGVGRQWCGALGKTDNCQVGLFAAYASNTGYTLLDRHLYLPKQWFDADHDALRKKTRIPPETSYQSSTDLAWTSLQALHAHSGLPFRWVAADEEFGKTPLFLDRIASLNLSYFAEVPVTTPVWVQRPEVGIPPYKGRGSRPTKVRLLDGEPDSIGVGQLAASLADEAWTVYKIKEGAKGPLVAKFAFVRVVNKREGLPGDEVWAVFRQGLSQDAELKCYLSNAPATTAHSAMVRVSGMRWPIETAFGDCKGHFGMDHYEVRSWLGWHHHMTLCILAHHFLVRTKLALKKKPQP